MKLRIHYIQHVPFEDPAYILTYVLENGCKVTRTRVYENEPFPEPAAFDWLIVMGGPMSVYEENLYPWLVNEKTCIGQAIESGKVVLGICLGAQMIADVLGARVYPHKHREIGWFPVTLTKQAETTAVFKGSPDIFMAFHWHGDTFDIPAGAVHCAQSAGCRNQSFVYNNRVVALQFHIEVIPASLAGIIEACGKDIKPDTFVQDTQLMIDGSDYCSGSNDILCRLLGALVKTTAKR